MSSSSKLGINIISSGESSLNYSHATCSDAVSLKHSRTASIRPFAYVGSSSNSFRSISSENDDFSSSSSRFHMSQFVCVIRLTILAGSIKTIGISTFLSAYTLLSFFLLRISNLNLSQKFLKVMSISFSIESQGKEVLQGKNSNIG